MFKKYPVIVLTSLFLYSVSLCMFNPENITEVRESSYYFHQKDYNATLEIRYNEETRGYEECFTCYKWLVDEDGIRIGADFEILDRRINPEVNEIYWLMVSFYKKDFHLPLKIREKSYKKFIDIEIRTIDD